jgi:hypothetical protein
LWLRSRVTIIWHSKIRTYVYVLLMIFNTS